MLWNNINTSWTWSTLSSMREKWWTPQIERVIKSPRARKSIAVQKWIGGIGIHALYKCTHYRYNKEQAVEM